MTEALRTVQDLVRGNLLGDRDADEVVRTLTQVAERLRHHGWDDGLGTPGTGPGPKNVSQVLSPPYDLLAVSGRGGREQSVHGTVTFPRLYLGSEGAVHGGALALWADDVLGRLGHAVCGDLTRTAYLHLDYLGLVPVDVELTFSAWVEQSEGRKRHLVAELTRNGEVLARASGLWVQVRRPA